MKSLGDIEKFFDGLVKRWSAQAAQAPAQKSLLEIRAAILRDIQARIEPIGRGRFVFPYNRITVTVRSPDEAQVEGFFGGEASLEKESRELLEHAGCPVAGLTVAVLPSADVADEAGVPFEIEYGRADAVVAPAAPDGVARPQVTVTVIRGTTGQSEYQFDQDRINIGRGVEVLSTSHGVLRVNDIVFGDDERTIGREHAYVRFDARSGRYRLYDDRSGDRGTRLFRDGVSILVTRAGSEVKSGDEIHLGVARLKVGLAPR